MVNMVMLVGRLTKDPEMVETENGTKVSRVTLAINRMFKNSDGVYQTDYVDCVLWNNFAKNVSNSIVSMNSGRIENGLIFED